MFTGIHEVRVMQDQGRIYAGYFDSEVAALSAVEQLGSYKAAWATLNPLRADALTPDTTINPTNLVRTHHSAADEHIDRREWLLLDFDAERPDTGQPATDAEKAVAREQAEQCRDELAAMGWPAPTVIDSGNGFHLRYRIHLPNDAAANGWCGVCCAHSQRGTQCCTPPTSTRRVSPSCPALGQGKVLPHQSGHTARVRF